MILLVARIVDQSDGAFQQTLLMPKMLVNIHSLTGSTAFFLPGDVVFHFPYQQRKPSKKVLCSFDILVSASATASMPGTSQLLFGSSVLIGPDTY